MCKYKLSTLTNSLLNMISRRFKSLFKICRGIALLDAMIDLIILFILLIRRFKDYQKDQTDPHFMQHLIRIGYQIFGIIFALVLFQGLRMRISCMVKAWLIYCIGRVVILVITILTATVSRIKLSVVIIQGTFVFFQIFQAVFILAYHREDAQEVTSHSECDSCKAGSGDEDFELAVCNYDDDVFHDEVIELKVVRI